MRIRSLTEVARLANAQLIRGNGEILVESVVIDSRMAREGTIFVALPGQNCHGIEHADAALEKGASAILCESQLSSRHRGPSLEVKEIHAGLFSLAAAVRAEEEKEVPVLAVTGSVGKTTTCKMLSALLSDLIPIHSPASSYNNKIGVPVTILEADPAVQALVLELGTNAPGEIAELADCARPSFGAVTAVSEAHLEGLGSLEGVLREKFSLLERIEGDGLWAPVELRDQFENLGIQYRWTGASGDLEIRPNGAGEVLVLDRIRSREFQLPWQPPAEWALRCLESAVALALELIDDPRQLWETARKIELPPWRHEVHRVEGIDLVLDCYNSSPLALRNAIDDLGRSGSQRKLAVLGTMEELGKDEKEFHVEAGRRCVQSGIDIVFVSGRAAQWIDQGVKEAGSESVFIGEGEQGAKLLKDHLEVGDRVLFKASRKEQLERLAMLVERQLQSEGVNP